TADRLPAGREQLVTARLTGLRACPLPAEHLAVKCERFFPISGEQLVPADAARRVEIGGFVLAAVHPLEYRDGCHLRVRGNGNAADVLHIFRRNVYGPAKPP